LIRLHADQPDHAPAGRADALCHRFDVDDGVALVAGRDFDIHLRPERAIARAFGHQAMDAGERIRR